jgi:hypothetical protein
MLIQNLGLSAVFRKRKNSQLKLTYHRIQSVNKNLFQSTSQDSYQTEPDRHFNMIQFIYDDNKQMFYNSKTISVYQQYQTHFF